MPPVTDATSPAALLAARGLSKKFEGSNALEVLKGVDLTLAPGDMFGIVGASGTGKSTLLQILGTLERPSSGTLLFDGQDVFARTARDLARFRNQTIGFVFQFHHLLPEFTALENLQMPGRIAGVPARDLEERGHALLGQVGLANRAKHKVGELSGGEQQRVAIARALFMRPRLLLADEPTGNLDPKTGRQVFDLFQELNHAFALASVIVTHNLELAGRLDRCFTLRDGTLSDEVVAPALQPGVPHRIPTDAA